LPAISSEAALTGGPGRKERIVTRRLLLTSLTLALIGPGLCRPARAQGVALELFSLLTAATAPAPSYTVTDLGTLGGSFSAPFGINNAGLAVGVSFTANDSAHHAFLIGGGMTKDLGTLGGPSSEALAINTTGQVAGDSLLKDGTTLHAFLWTGAALQDLGTLGGSASIASGINDAGQVCGAANLSTAGTYHAFLWTNGAMKDLGTLGDAANSSFAYGVNAAGQATGTAGDIYGGPIHAFLWKNGAMKDLGTLGGDFSYGNAINGAGQVVGAADLDPGHRHAFLWADGTMTDLGTLGGTYSHAYGINAAGQVVGASTTRIDQLVTGDYLIQYAFLWSGGTMKDLNQLIPPGSGWFLASAQSINDTGQIVGIGTFNGQERAFLLTPAR
jgi:probable HAF family extracellular repeat protein